MANEHKENQNQTSSKTDDNDGWGFDLFPERRGTLKNSIKSVLFQGRGNENIERIKCERRVSSCLSKSKMQHIQLHLLSLVSYYLFKYYEFVFIRSFN